MPEKKFKTIDEYGDMDVVELSYSKDRDPKAPPVRFILLKMTAIIPYRRQIYN